MIDKKKMKIVAKGPRAVLDNDCTVEKTLAKTMRQTKPTRTGRWTQEEKLLFLYGLSKFGRGKWKRIGYYLPTRSLIQIKSHAQKVMKRFEAGENVFAALEENREYFDCLVLPSARLAKKKGNADLLNVPPLTDECFKTTKLSLKGRKGQSGKASPVRSANLSTKKQRKDLSSRPLPKPLLPRRSVFQATLGNGNLSFSFKNGSRIPISVKTESSYSSSEDVYKCNSPDPFGHSDARGDSAIAAAALCQLSCLGRSEQTVVVSP